MLHRGSNFKVTHYLAPRRHARCPPRPAEPARWLGRSGRAVGIRIIAAIKELEAAEPEGAVH